MQMKKKKGSQIFTLFLRQLFVLSLISTILTIHRGISVYIYIYSLCILSHAINCKKRIVNVHISLKIKLLIGTLKNRQKI